MSSRVRRSIDLGPRAAGSPGLNGDPWAPEDFRYIHPTYGSNANMYTQTGTTWIRLWAGWSVMQPYADVVLGQPVQESNPEPPGGSEAKKRLDAWRSVEVLDKEIAAARSRGLEIILCAWRCPPWANGTAAQAANRDSGDPSRMADEFEYARFDRMRKPVYDAWVASNSNRNLRDNTLAHKQLEYRFPTYLDSTSPWAMFIRFLYDRWRPSRATGGGWITALEVCNEPNLQMWPQQDTSLESDPWGVGNLSVQCSVGQMMQTAMTIGEAFGNELHLAGPATWDGVNPPETVIGRMRTMSNDLTPYVIGALDASNSRPGSKFIWTHHNYGDLDERRRSTSNNVAHLTRTQLRGAWTGYAEDNGPVVFITEGGAHLKTIGDRLGVAQTSQAAKTEQGALVAANGSDMNQADGANSVGDGIGMITAYTMYGEEGLNTPAGTQDTGLRDQVNLGGAARPAFNSWGAINSPRGAPSDWHGPYDLAVGALGETTVASWAPNRLDIFYTRTIDPQLWHTWWNGVWNGPEALGGWINAKPAAVSWGSGRLDIVVRGGDNACYLRVYQGQWFDYQSLGGVLAYGPAISSRGPGLLDIWVIGSDGALYQKSWTGSGCWPSQTGWSRIGGGPFASAPTAVSGRRAASTFSCAAPTTSLSRSTTTAHGRDGVRWAATWAGPPPFARKGRASSTSTPPMGRATSGGATTRRGNGRTGRQCRSAAPPMSPRSLGGLAASTSPTRVPSTPTSGIPPGTRRSRSCRSATLSSIASTSQGGRATFNAPAPRMTSWLSSATTTAATTRISGPRSTRARVRGARTSRM
jgi:hypothetical protein